MKYSEIYIRNGFRVDLLVDNATTHTKALIVLKELFEFIRYIREELRVLGVKYVEFNHKN